MTDYVKIRQELELPPDWPVYYDIQVDDWRPITQHVFDHNRAIINTLARYREDIRKLVVSLDFIEQTFINRRDEIIAQRNTPPQS